MSKTKMTEKVAGIVRDGLKEKGNQVDVFKVQDSASLKLEDYDRLIVGSPTMAWKPTEDTRKFLDGLQGKNFAGKSAVSFDTQMKSAISGNANKMMTDKLTKAGFKIMGSPLQAYVKNSKEGYHFLDGEEGRIKEWAKGLPLE